MRLGLGLRRGSRICLVRREAWRRSDLQPNENVIGTYCDSLGNTTMSKSTRNTGKPWTATEVKSMQGLAKANTPTRVIGLKLGRTEGAISNKASEQGISLKPTNQSPYNRKK